MTAIANLLKKEANKQLEGLVSYMIQLNATNNRINEFKSMKIIKLRQAQQHGRIKHNA